MKSLLSSALTAIQNYIEKNHSGNVASAARDLDISIPTLHSWLNGTRIPSFSKMAPLLEKIGAYIVSQDETGPSKEVCFVDAKVVPAGEIFPRLLMRIIWLCRSWMRLEQVRGSFRRMN